MIMLTMASWIVTTWRKRLRGFSSMAQQLVRRSSTLPRALSAFRPCIYLMAWHRTSSTCLRSACSSAFLLRIWQSTWMILPILMHWWKKSLLVHPFFTITWARKKSRSDEKEWSNWRSMQAISLFWLEPSKLRNCRHINCSRSSFIRGTTRLMQGKQFHFSVTDRQRMWQRANLASSSLVQCPYLKS